MPRCLVTAALVLLAAGALAGCTSSGSKSASTSPAPSSASSSPAQSQTTAPTLTPPAPVATFATVKGKATTLHFAHALVHTLYTHGVATRATGKARLVAVPGSSNAVLPITAGNASFYKLSTRTSIDLRHDTGGLTLSSDSGSVRLEDISLQIGPKLSVSADVVVTTRGASSPARTLTLFDLVQTASFRTAVSNGTATVTGLRIYLGAQLGKLLDKTLGTSIFVTGKRVFAGTVTISITSA